MENHMVRGVICTVLGAVSWGVSGAFNQFLFMNYDISAIWVTDMRLLIAGLIIFSTVLFRHSHEVVILCHDKKDVRQVALFALAGLVICQGAYLLTIQYSNAGTATVLQSLSVVILTIFVSISTHTRPNRITLYAIGLALVGVFLITTNGNPSKMVLSWEGFLFGLGAALGGANYKFLSRHIVKRWGSRIINGMGMLLGGVFLTVVTQAWQYTVSLDLVGYGALAFVIVIGTAGAFTLVLQGVSDIGPVKTSLIGFLEPITATLVSVFWLHTKFTLMDLIGFVCILTTVYIVTIYKSDTDIDKN